MSYNYHFLSLEDEGFDLEGAASYRGKWPQSGWTERKGSDVARSSSVSQNHPAHHTIHTETNRRLYFRLEQNTSCMTREKVSHFEHLINTNKHYKYYREDKTVFRCSAVIIF